ncbi:MAG: CoB--CoM heterodisulfide reductase iron-sulfur subunit B family protein [Candidatus Hydrothermarchaeota archaeon]
MKYSFFPGCLAKNVYPSIENSARLIFKRLGVELIDLRFSCCPAPGVLRSYDQEAWLSIGARNLSLSEREGLDILVICNGCYGSLSHSNHMLKEDEKREMINENLKAIGLRYDGNVRVIHFLDVLDELRPEIEKNKKFDLGLKVAAHYGCHYLKPSMFCRYNSENPEELDEFIEMLGCESVEFRDRLTCCGAGGGLWSGNEKISLEIAEKKLEYIEDARVDCIVNICPFCHIQLDQSQVKLKRFEIPVLHLTQLIGLALGIKDKQLGLHTHLTSTAALRRELKRLKTSIQ